MVVSSGLTVFCICMIERNREKKKQQKWSWDVGMDFSFIKYHFNDFNFDIRDCIKNDSKTSSTHKNYNSLSEAN